MPLIGQGMDGGDLSPGENGVLSTAGTGCVLEIRPRKHGCVVDVFGVGERHGHEPRQFDNKVAGTQAATPGCNDVVGIRSGMPRDVRGFRSILDPVKEFRGRTGVGTLVERDVDKHVGARGMGGVADLAIPVLDPDAAPRRPYSKHSVHSPGPMLRPQTLVPVAVRSVCLAVGSADRPFIMSLSAPVAPSLPRRTTDGSILAARRRQMSVGLRQRVPDQPTAHRLMRCQPPESAPDPATNH